MITTSNDSCTKYMNDFLVYKLLLQWHFKLKGHIPMYRKGNEKE